MNALHKSLLFGLALTVAATATAQSKAYAPVNTAGAGKVALAGHDPVAFFTDKAPVDGSPSIQVEHAGAIYYFASKEHRQAFVKSPARYLPQYGGYCAFGMSVGAFFPVDVDTWVVRDGKLYLNLNPAVAGMFAKDMDGVLKKAEVQWRSLGKPKMAGKPKGDSDLVNVAGLSRVAIDGHDPVSFFVDGKPVAGSPEITAKHGGATYFFASKEHRASFLEDPARFVPQYGGYCAYGMSLGAMLPADVDTFVIREGKLYLNLNPEVAKAFAKDPSGTLAKADKKWRGMQGMRH